MLVRWCVDTTNIVQSQNTWLGSCWKGSSMRPPLFEGGVQNIETMSIGDAFNGTGDAFNLTRDAFNWTGDSFNNTNSLEDVALDWLEFTGITFGFSILAGLAAIVLFYLAICLIGFTCCGVLAGSSAACCQSSIGDVAAGSWFSCCQSVGACGTFWPVILLFLLGFFTTGTLLFMQKMNDADFHPVHITYQTYWKSKIL